MILRKAALVALAGALSVHAQAPAAAGRFSSAAKAEFSRQLENAVQRGDTPGVVAEVVDRAEPIYIGAAGKLSPNTIFAIASMTKPITSVAIMMLLEQGELKLDDPVSKYLPGFDNLQVIAKFNEKDGSYQTRPAARPITIRHLLTHTSGLAYSFSNPIADRLGKGTTKDAWELPLLNDPGEKWTYGPSTRLLGRVIEKVAGVTLEAYFQQHILGPLGMVDTSFAVPIAKQARVATRHNRVNGILQEQKQGKIPSVPTPPFSGDGGLYSTAEDYGRFIQMMLNDGRAGSEAGSVRILSESSVKLMGQNNIGDVLVETQTGADQTLSKPFPLGASHDKFGLGFQITAKDPQYANFRSPGSMSWAGLFNTEFWIDPVKHIGGIQLMQLLPFYDEGAIRTLRGFEEAVYRNLR